MHSDNLPYIYQLTYRFGHHHATSGYDRLGDFIPSKVVEIPRLAGNVLKAVFHGPRYSRLIERTGLPGYFPECLWLEMRAYQCMKMPRRSILHFIYPENSYYFTSMFKKAPGCRLICTYHQPVEQSRQFIKRTDPIRKLDAVILLADSQREFFEPLVGNERIFVVPYGIDLDRFPYEKRERDNGRIIAVGNWLRDFTTFAGALEILQHRAPEIRCDVVTLESNRPYFQNLRNVDFHCGISHEKLLQLYARASISVLAYSTAAASGALLESLALGLPLVVTDLPSIREYTNPEGCRYIPVSDSMALAETVTALGREPSVLARMERTNHEHAQQFVWENVAKKTIEVYKTVGSW